MKMTVAEMITKLQTLPQELKVGSWNYHFKPVQEGNDSISVETTTEDVDTEQGIQTKEIKVVCISFAL